MNSDYFCEARPSCCENRSASSQATPSKQQPVSNLNAEINQNAHSSHSLKDYEIVTNEQFDEVGRAVAVGAPAPLQKEVANANGDFRLHKDDNGEKLRLNLNAQKITLKSQTTKINKSITPEAEACGNARANEAKRHTTTTLLHQPHIQRAAAAMAPPINFTILPINTAPPRRSNEGAKNLPEIVLTSFEARKSAPTTATAKVKATSVTFQRAASPSAPEPKQNSNALPISEMSPETRKLCSGIDGINVINNNNNCNDKVPLAEVIERSYDTAESSASNSQVGSSTSPESLMDNVLSAASSVSVRSSSSSNDNGSGQRGRLSGADKLPLPNNAMAYVNLAVSSAPNGNTREMHANRALNPKSPPDVRIPTQLQLASEIHTLQTLQLPSPAPAIELSETHSNRSRSPSPSVSMSIRLTPDPTLYPDELKCSICMEVLRDPRTLNCLHSFCFQCLVDENFKQDSSIPFWSQLAAGEDNDWKAAVKSNYSLRSLSPEMSLRSGSDSAISPMPQRRPSFNFIRKKSMDKILLKTKSDGKGSVYASSTRLNNTSEERQRVIICKICQFSTELAIGGLRQLPQNFMLVRKIEEVKLTVGDEVISRVWCSLCFDEINATYHCVDCTLNLCTLCKESHERQRTTTDHNIKNLMELRRARKQRQNLLGDNMKFSLKCGMHPGFEMKSFCCSCLQVACADCLVLLHKGHKHEPIAKAIVNYAKILRDSAEQTRPLCNYAEHSIERLNEIARNINKKCDEIQTDVDTYIKQYFDALEVHRKTLTQQVRRARESKVDMILEQQLDLEKRTNETMEAVRFSQELSNIASDVEILSFVNILLKRFEYCQQFKMPVDPKISDSLHFLPKIRAPFAKSQNGIPLFGIITMQTVEPALCTLLWEGFTQLRLHKKAELLLLSRDADGAALCHGGLEINALLKYKDNHLKFLPVDISDNRDGTYGVSFTPDSQGSLLLTVTINDKPIKDTPFTFVARTVRPHSGIFHCCTFCSSKGNKMVKCCCEGRMPGYAGCGHGHAGHPGRRHWSCCANVLENSECNVENKLLNS